MQAPNKIAWRALETLFGMMGPATLPPTTLTGIWPLSLLPRVSLGLGPFVKRILLSLWNGFEGFALGAWETHN